MLAKWIIMLLLVTISLQNEMTPLVDTFKPFAKALELLINLMVNI